jgi:hypothetical protein
MHLCANAQKSAIVYLMARICQRPGCGNLVREHLMRFCSDVCKKSDYSVVGYFEVGFMKTRYLPPLMFSSKVTSSCTPDP